MENLTNDPVVPIMHETDFEMELFVMGFQECKNAWTPVNKEKIETRMELENKEGKFAIALIGGNQSIVGHLMEGITRRFAKTIIFFSRGVCIIDVTFVLLVKQLNTEMVKG